MSTHRLIESQLHGFDVSIVHCPTAEDALEYLERRRPIVLVVIEALLPRMTGIALGRVIRSTESLMEVPLVFITPRTDADDDIVAVELDATLLQKPFPPRAFRDVATALLREPLAAVLAVAILCVNLCVSASCATDPVAFGAPCASDAECPDPYRCNDTVRECARPFNNDGPTDDTDAGVGDEPITDFSFDVSFPKAAARAVLPPSSTTTVNDLTIDLNNFPAGTGFGHDIQGERALVVAQNLVIHGQLRFLGSMPVTLVAFGDVNLDVGASIDVAARSASAGPGARALAECLGQAGSGTGPAGVGGGGGGGATAGGAGGVTPGGTGGGGGDAVGPGGGCRGGAGAEGIVVLVHTAGGAGGAGGGSVIVAAAGTLTVNGAINARGGVGGAGVTGVSGASGGGGGGGSGGWVRIEAAAMTGSGHVDASGGAGGVAGDGSAGGIGSDGAQSGADGTSGSGGGGGAGRVELCGGSLPSTPPTVGCPD